MSGLTPDREALRAELEEMFPKAYEPILLLLTTHTGDPAKAAALAERVFEAAGHERTSRTTEQWMIWCWEKAGRVYDEDFLESCGIRP
ncbi:hypothetical protein PL81_16995 [Streptomyces sp. RSD-27]|nr:hypothetical protein PL81_16995 [Streptomyces sp. RSD-27]